jgi:hypothetical protein
MKRANHGTNLKGKPKNPKAPDLPPQKTGKLEGDAREDDRQLAENQQELGVGEDHKTEEMEEGGRGTFP